jgi:hypothetical protein
MKRFGFGYKPDTPDPRDRPASLRYDHITPAPRVNLSRLVLDVLDQGGTSTCMTHAVAQAIRVRQAAFGDPHPPLTNLLVPYWDARADRRVDDGLQPRVLFQTYRTKGYCLEGLWRFREDLVFTPPPPITRSQSYDQIGLLEYTRCADSGGAARKLQMQQALTAEHPLVLALTVDLPFLRYTRGVWDFGGQAEGRHGVCAVGYDEHGVRIVNSYGAWGDWDERGRKGFATIGWRTIEDPVLCTDVYSLDLAPRPTEYT